MRWVLAFFAWLLFSCTAVTASAATVAAPDCSAAAVQAAIDAAAPGDVVTVPAGSCSWAGTVVALPSDKKLTLQGAGVDATKITALDVAVRIGDVGTGGASRVTGFTFVGGGIQVDGDGWRVDHVKFQNASGLIDGVLAYGLRPGAPYGPTGLVDHVQFINARVLVIGFPDIPTGEAPMTASPLGLGDANAVYIEDSSFTFSGQPNVIDCNYAGRFVFRRNTVNGSSIDAHSVQGWNRACRRWEIYDNAITTSVPYFTPMFIRGGTGVIFDNTITGSWSEPFISFDNVRSFESRPNWFPVDQTHPGACDGSSPWDGNQTSNGWPCRDQIGRGGDITPWTNASPYPRQTSEPAYLWNNTMNGAPAQVQIRNDSGAWIQAGRDYVNGTPRPGYAALPYPHPLIGGSPPPPPPPATLSVTRVGTGSGTVTSAPAGIDCGSDCSESYPSGTSVTLAAMPAAGSSFDGWSACSGTATCTVALTAMTSVQATFTAVLPAPVTVSLSANPASVQVGGLSTLTWSSTSATSCTAANVGAEGSTWTGPKPTSGSDVRGPLEATATYSLVCVGPGGSVGQASVTVTVAASPPPPPTAFILTASVSGPGTVTIDGSLVNCVSCAVSYASGRVVTLMAQPETGARFLGWTGTACAAAGTGPCAVTVMSSTTVTARFARP